MEMNALEVQNTNFNWKRLALKIKNDIVLLDPKSDMWEAESASMHSEKLWWVTTTRHDTHMT